MLIVNILTMKSDVQIQCFLYQISQVRIELQKRFRSQLQKTGLELNDFYALTIVFEHGVKTASELSHHLHLSAPTLSVLLKKMVNKKLISMTVDENDGKQKIITGTDLGRKNWLRAKSILKKTDEELNLSFGLEIRQFRKFYHKFMSKENYEK